MNFKGKDIISIYDFSKAELLHILKVAKQVHLNPKRYSSALKESIMATLFFEPSTRTRLSFTSSMEQLGGRVLGFATADVTSAQKGETLWDTIKMIQNYADLITIRHPLDGSARLAAEASKVPIINGGDGSNQHPTQTMLDLYTIQKTKGKLNNLHVGFLGDLKYGRTVHSLIVALSHFNPTFYFISPAALKIPDHYLEELKEKNIRFFETSSLGTALGRLDVLYVTRIQKERFPEPLEYQKYKGVYKITNETLKGAKHDLKVMHPLPRVDEISKEVDDSPHAIYYDQAANGIPVRKALILLISGKVK
tara:strand:- start:19053 stop:19976 length:924 start_codon:yes stop_codon:yes gene_type:complete